MAVEADYYEQLAIERTADDGTIKASYRKLAMRWHPDRNPGDAAAEAKFKAISEAYECLKDPQKRAAYDRFGHEAFKQGMSGGGQGGGAGFSDLGDIFETIFGSAFGGGGRNQPRRGADLRYDMEIGLDEAFHGKQAAIEIEVAAMCEPCDAAICAVATGRFARSRASLWSNGLARPATDAAK
jgi:molecular chaperone DnaJ